MMVSKTNICRKDDRNSYLSPSYNLTAVTLGVCENLETIMNIEFVVH
jgi:hypothetical protein